MLALAPGESTGIVGHEVRDHVVDVRVVAPEVRVAVLELVTGHNVLDSRVPDVPDREEHLARSSTDGAKVVRETEHREVILPHSVERRDRARRAELYLHRTEVTVLPVGERTVCDELGPDGVVRAGLECRVRSNVCGVICGSVYICSSAWPQ
jgi:hypothetical protein